MRWQGLSKLTARQVEQGRRICAIACAQSPLRQKLAAAGLNLPAEATAVAGASTADDPASQVPSGMENCASCDLCIPIAELASARLDIVGFAAQALPLTGGANFVSASPAPTLKPPIS